MGSCRQIEPQLSLLADGDLDAREAANVQAHLRACEACRGLLADLERLRASARSLGPMAPPSSVWAGIDEQIRRGAAGIGTPPLQATGDRRAIWQWAGLAAGLLLVTTVVYLLGGDRRTVPPAESAGTTAADGTADPVGQATVPYESAIRELESLAATTEAAIEPGVAAVVRTNLGAIDTAIADSRAALVANPESESARDSLFEALRRKIALLQTTVALINDMRAGNQEGAAEAADKLGKQS